MCFGGPILLCSHTFVAEVTPRYLYCYLSISSMFSRAGYSDETVRRKINGGQRLQHLGNIWHCLQNDTIELRIAGFFPAEGGLSKHKHKNVL